VSSRLAQLRLRIAFRSSATEGTAAPFEPPRDGQPDLPIQSDHGMNETTQIIRTR